MSGRGAPASPPPPWARHAPSAALLAFVLGLTVALHRAGPLWLGLAATCGAALTVASAIARGWQRAALVALLALCLVSGWTWSGARIVATAPAPPPAAGPVSGTVVVDTPPIPAAHGGWRMRARADGLRGADGAPVDGTVRLLLTIRGAEEPPIAGERLRLSGRLRPAATRASPAWWHRWLERQRISARLSVRAPRAVGRRGGIAGLRDRWRAWATRNAGAGLSGDTGGLVRGMALGGGSLLSEEAAEAFRDAGIWHLLAVSGQNVTVVALAVLALLRALGIAHRPAVAGAGVVMLAYCLACDGGASVARAGTVGALALVAELRGSGRDRWVLLVAGLALLLAVQPRAIHDPGLQLSFAAVVGLFAIAPPLAEAGRRVLPAAVAELAAMAFGAGLATAPVVAHHFERLSLVGFVVNVVAVPLAAPIVVIALAGIAVGALSPLLGVVLAHVAALGADLLLLIARSAAAVPGATAPLTGAAVPVLVALAAAPVLLSRSTAVAAARRDPRRAMRAAACLVGAVAVVWLQWPRDQPPPWPATAAITMLDVGQGDAILLRGPAGEAMLVDAGPPGAPAAVVPALARHGVTRIDLLVITHGDSDHVGGAADLMRAVSVGTLVHPPRPADGWSRAMREAIEFAPSRGARVGVVRAGQDIVAGPWRARVLWPQGAIGRGVAPNDGSIVVDARAGGLSVLLTGDAEGSVVRRLATAPVDVLKVAHHGSADPALASVLARVSPSLALISSGEGNNFGHPHPTVLAELAAVGVPVRRTDHSGDLTVRREAGRLIVE